METKTCVICDGDAYFKIKGENIYYCQEHAQEFFSSNSLMNVEKIKLGEKQANILKKFLEK